MCDPIWHVISRSAVVISIMNCYIRVYFTLLYPALQKPYPELGFYDQFAFRPTCSTTAAVIALLHTVLTMVSNDQYVHVFSFHFTKAFDTARDEAWMSEMAQLNVPDKSTTGKRRFSRCIITVLYRQRMFNRCSWEYSGLGPASFIVAAVDLRPTIPENRIFKFVDDTYTWWYQRQTQAFDYKN